MTTKNPKTVNHGVVVAVRGSVVDVRFDDHLPPIYSVLHADEEDRIVIEVLAQRDAHHVRGIALTPTQGLSRGMAVKDTGGPLTAPIGKAILSRMFDVFGNTIDREPPLTDVQWRSVHRDPPPLAQRLFHNHPTSGAVYAPVSQRLLPLDDDWRRGLAERHWTTKNLPEVIGGGRATMQALIREYLFVSLFRACAESLASENASRLAAMQRADKNIDELLDVLNATYHRLRQGGIDEELFDVISGFEALSSEQSGPAS